MASVPFKFPTSGVEIKIRKFSPLILADMSQSFPAPKPPMQEVELDGKIRKEPNFSHPEYLDAVQQHQVEQQRLTQRAIVRLGVDYSLTPSDREDLARVLSFMKDSGATPQGDSELEQWVYYVAVNSSEDITALTEEVLSLSQATPKSD